MLAAALPAQGVVNRDMKLENTLLHTNGRTLPKPLIKLCDFGYSKHEVDHSAAKTLVGTHIYYAPEIIQNHRAQRPEGGYDGKVGLEQGHRRHSGGMLGCSRVAA